MEVKIYSLHYFNIRVGSTTIIGGVREPTIIPRVIVKQMTIFSKNKYFKGKEYSTPYKEKEKSSNFTGKKIFKCYKCGKIGHIKKFC